MAITFHPDGRVTGNTLKSPGNVIQVVSSQITGTSSIASSSGTPVATGMITSLTPKGVGSKFYVTCVGNNLHNNHGASNPGVRVYLYCKIGSGSYANVTSAWIQSSHRSGGSWTDFPGSMTFTVTPTYSSGDTVYFQPYFGQGNGTSATYYWHHPGGSGTGQIIQQTVMEIAG